MVSAPAIKVGAFSHVRPKVESTFVKDKIFFLDSETLVG